MSLLATSRILALLAAYVFLLWRWFHDPSAATGELRATSLVAPLTTFVVTAVLVAWAHRGALVRMRAELGVALQLGVRDRSLLGVALLLSFLFQLPTMLFPAGLLHADAAINGLMGMHIAAGRVAPAFYYGQEFMGTLFSHVLAVLFAVTGPFAAGSTVLTWVFYAGFLAATFQLVRQAADGVVAFGVAGWLAAPPVLLIVTLAQSEYPQLFVLSGWALVVIAAAIAGRLREPGWWIVAGGLLGLAFWAHPMAFAPALAAALSVAWLLSPRRAVAAGGRAALGFVLGIAPGLVGWGARLGRFVEWFLAGGGRGGDATLAGAATGMARVSLGNLLAGTENRVLLPWTVAVPLLVVVVGAAATLMVRAVQARRFTGMKGRLPGSGAEGAPGSAATAEGAPRYDGPAEDALPHDKPAAGARERAAAGLPLALFVLLQLAVLVSRRYTVTPTQYIVPLYLGVPAVVGMACWSLVRGWRRGAPLVAAALLAAACVPLPASIGWLRGLPDNQASMNTSLTALRAAGVDACIGPYWDAYRISYLTREAILCESIGVRRVPGYGERVARRSDGMPAFVAAPQRDDTLAAHRRSLEAAGVAWISLRTPRFEALLPRRR